MADADYRAWVEVLPEFVEFNQQIQSGVVGGMAGAGRAGSAAMGGTLVAGVGRFAGPLIAAIAAIGIGTAIFSAVKSGIDASIDYVSGAVGLAADLEQSVGAVNAVFKENAGQIEAWSQASSQSVGLSRGNYLEFATVVGAQLKNLGIPFEDVAGRTDNLIGLGADLAAQFGGSTSDAVAALSSLLRGERDPIERYGVSIKEADISARLARDGLTGLTGEAERQARILATLQILNEQTADAQGTFAREADTFLGVQQRLNAEFENTQAELGEQLLPILTEVMKFVANEIMPLWQDFNETVGPQLREALEEAWPDIKRFIEEALPVLAWFLPRIIDFVVWLIEVTREWALAIGNTLNGISSMFQLLNGDITFEEFLKQVADGAGFMFEFGKAVSGFVTDALTNFAKFAGGVNQSITDALGFVGSLPRRAVDALGNLGNTLFNAGRSLIQGFIDGIKQMLRPVGDAISGVLNFAAGFFPHSPAERGPFAGSGWRRLLGSGGAIMDAFESGLRPVTVPLGLGDAMVSGLDVVSGFGFPRELTLVVDGRPMRAYIQEGIDEFDERFQQVRRGRLAR